METDLCLNCFSVVLVTIFLAIVVDKLSEVRSLEEDFAKQNAKRKEERKAREEHINALKVDEPQVRRTTIRRAMKYLSDNPTVRARAVQEPGRKLWQQTSLPAGSVSKKRTSLFQPHSDKPPKTMSVPLIDTPIHLREEPGVQSGDTGRTVRSRRQQSGDTGQTVCSRRQRNPLRLIRPTSGYFEMQNKRRKGGSSVIASIPPHTKPTTTRENTTAVSTNQQPSAASVFVFPPSVEEAQHSATSTPASASVVPSSTAPQKMDLPYERTQSLPAGTPSTSESERLISSMGDGAQELEVIIEGTSEVDGEEKRERWAESTDSLFCFTVNICGEGSALFPDSHPTHENLGMRLLKNTKTNKLLCNYFVADFRDKSTLRNHQSFYPRTTKGAVTSVRHHYHHYQLILLVMMYPAGWVKRAHLK